MITQKILSYTSGITTGLQTRGIDLANVSDQINLVIRTLSHVRQDVESFHRTCYDEACSIARKITVDIKRPRLCERQIHQQNALQLSSKLLDDQLIEQYFRINVTIALLDVLGSLQSRFEEGQTPVVKGTMLLPSSTISEPDWDNGFVQLYFDEIPSNHTFEAEKVLWKQLLQEKWEQTCKALNEQYITATGAEMKLNATELKHGAVPNTIALTSKVISQPFTLYPFWLSFPLLHCKAERSISVFLRLKTYIWVRIALLVWPA